MNTYDPEDDFEGPDPLEEQELLEKRQAKLIEEIKKSTGLADDEIKTLLNTPEKVETFHSEMNKLRDTDDSHLDLDESGKALEDDESTLDPSDVKHAQEIEVARGKRDKILAKRAEKRIQAGKANPEDFKAFLNEDEKS